MNNEQMVALYIKTVDGPVNGWGQCVVNAPGTAFHGVQSHAMLRTMIDDIGRRDCFAMIDAAFAKETK